VHQQSPRLLPLLQIRQMPLRTSSLLKQLPSKWLLMLPLEPPPPLPLEPLLLPLPLKYLGHRPLPSNRSLPPRI
jgi:hypothetical protein